MCNAFPHGTQRHFGLFGVRRGSGVQRCFLTVAVLKRKRLIPLREFLTAARPLRQVATDAGGIRAGVLAGRRLLTLLLQLGWLLAVPEGVRGHAARQQGSEREEIRPDVAAGRGHDGDCPPGAGRPQAECGCLRAPARGY